MRVRLLMMLAAGALISSAATAQTERPSVGTLIDAAAVAEFRSWIDHPVVAISVAAQNMRHADIDQETTDALDRQWRAEREAIDQPLIAQTIARPLSGYLTRLQAWSDGLITEVFIVDRYGLNVGQSAVTSDYWQGDEAKFLETVPHGPDALFIDEAEYHGSSGTWRVQVNMSIPSADGEAVIGAMTVEINLTELARRRAAAS